MTQSLAGKMVMAARAMGYREFMSGRSIVLSVCSNPKCGKKRVIRFRKVVTGKPGAAVIDKCWGCGKSVVVSKTPIQDKPTADPMLCPCGCGDKRPNKKAQYAHGRVCAARIKSNRK
jgi:hypothetical protein